MECSCSVDVCSDGAITVLKEKIVTAKKEHKCSECGRKIKKEESYEYASGVWETKLNIYKTCLDCLSLRKQFFKDGFCYNAIWEMFEEEFRDTEIPESCISKLTPGARAKVCVFIEWCWENDEDFEEFITQV